MKKLIFIGLLTLITSCKAQKNNLKNNQMKTFDIETFEKNKNHLNEYSFITKDSSVIEQGEWQFGYEETIKPKGLYLQTYNKYFKNGKILMTGDFFPNDFEKGVWKEYNEQGNLITETDYDAPYKFTWEDILEFIKERKIDMGTPQFQVNRNFDFGNFDESKKDKPFWAITYEDGSDTMKVIILDGITGKMIKEFNEDYPIEE